MTARRNAERRVRTSLRALEAALASDPIDRTRVTEMATKLADAVDGLPGDDRFNQLDRAVGAVGMHALAWSFFDLHDAELELYNARVALNLQRRCLAIDGVVTPY